MTSRGLITEAAQRRGGRRVAAAVIVALLVASVCVHCGRKEPPPSGPPGLDDAVLRVAAERLNDDPVLHNPVFNLPACGDGIRVHSADELYNTLSNAAFHGCVVVPRGSNFDMSKHTNIRLHSGVTVIGERGPAGTRPTLYTSNKNEDYAFFEITEFSEVGDLPPAVVRVDGLHLRGPAAGIRDNTQKVVNGIRIVTNPDRKDGRQVVISNSELDEWTGSAIEVRNDPSQSARVPEQYPAEWARHTKDDAGRVAIEGNYIHNNPRNSLGYGVVVSAGAYATIEANVFDFNRHDIASDGAAHTGYIARFNYILDGGFQENGYYNQHFDVHGTNDTNGDNQSTGYGGTAGEYFDVAFNAFRGAQTYGCVIVCKTRPAFMLRGAPTDGGYFHGNVAKHSDLDAAVALKDQKGGIFNGIFISGSGEDHGRYHFHPSDNQFGVDHSNDLAAGDFDGDGFTDVFVATGTAWFYSRRGLQPWEFLHASNLLTRDLAFADIDNDHATDILFRDSQNKLGYFKSGVVPRGSVAEVPVPITDLRFDDFDGDNKTDIFYTKDGRWHTWLRDRGQWIDAQTSSLPLAALRFGNFDPKPGTDVAAVTSGMWAYSSGATGSWDKLNDRLKPSFAEAVIADFDGDGTSDIAFDEGGQRWTYSPGGRQRLATLRDGGGTTNYPPLRNLLIGYFYGQKAQVLAFSRGDSPNANFVVWGGLGSRSFVNHSAHPMR
jgi:FG-GAP repeat